MFDEDSDIDKKLAPYYAEMSGHQKQIFYMTMGMIVLLLVIEQKGEGGYLTRSEIVEAVNNNAVGHDIVEAVLIVARENGVPL